MHYNNNMNYDSNYKNYGLKTLQQDWPADFPDFGQDSSASEPRTRSSVIPTNSKNTFIKDGIEYECEQVYICRQIVHTIPQKIEPSQSETFIEVILWQDENIPEYKLEKCNNALGFCLRTRNSIMRIFGRLIYPYDISGELFNEIEDCFNVAISAATTVVAVQAGLITAAPESAPAVLPNLLNSAFAKGNAAFFDCLSTKTSYAYLKNKIKFTVYYEQESEGSWETFNERDALKLLEKFYLYSTGLILIPGVGSIADLADKIGIDREGVENFFSTPGKSLEKWGNEIMGGIDKLF